MFIVRLGIYDDKAKRKVCSLHFQEAKEIKEGGDSSKAQLFICQDI